MDAIDPAACICEKELMVIGVVGCGRGMRLHELSARQVLHVTTVGRLPTKGVAEKRGEVSIRVLLGLSSRRPLERTVPPYHARAVEGHDIADEIQKDCGDGVSAYRRSRHGEREAL